VNSVLLALALAVAAMPARAPARFVCPRCPRPTFVFIVSHYSYEDQTTKAIEDRCGFLHYHDASYEMWLFECTHCGERASEREDAPACACGWSATEQRWDDPCPEADTP
jgi:hypothetical protein